MYAICHSFTVWTPERFWRDPSHNVQPSCWQRLAPNARWRVPRFAGCGCPGSPGRWSVVEIEWRDDESDGDGSCVECLVPHGDNQVLVTNNERAGEVHRVRASEG